MSTTAAFGPAPGEDPSVWAERLRDYYLAEGLDSPQMRMALLYFHDWATYAPGMAISRGQLLQMAEGRLARALAGE